MSPVLGPVMFLVIKVIVFSISTIQDFKVTASASAATLASFYFLTVKLNYWVINDVIYFTFEAPVYPVAVYTLRDSSPVGYTLPPVIDLSSPRRDI